MNRLRGRGSKDLGRRAFGSAGAGEPSCDAPERFGEVVDLADEILSKPPPPVSRAWKPRAGCIYNFPVRRVVEEK